MKFILPFLCLAGLGLFVALQRRAIGEMKGEVVRLNQQNASSVEHERARKNEDLKRSRAELDALRAAQLEAETLRREIARLGAPETSTSANTPEAKTDPAVKPRSWSNAGNATPAATVETVLWSALNGDTDTLATLIAFEPNGRARLDALFARLPETQRQSSGSPEKVFATLLAARLPQDLSTADVVTNSEDAARAKLRLHLAYANGSEKEATFNFNRTSAGWRLIIPDSIAENYQQMLANAPK